MDQQESLQVHTQHLTYQESVVLLGDSIGEICRLYVTSWKPRIRRDEVHGHVGEDVVRVSYLVRLVDEKEICLVVPRPWIEICALRIVAWSNISPQEYTWLDTDCPRYWRGINSLTKHGPFSERAPSRLLPPGPPIQSQSKQLSSSSICS